MKKTLLDIAIMEKVKELRKSHNVSQADLAYKALNLDSYSLIGKIESMKYPNGYNIEHLNAIALFFKVSLHSLIPVFPIEEKKTTDEQ